MQKYLIRIAFIILLAFFVSACTDEEKTRIQPQKKKMVNTTKTDKFSFYRANEIDQKLYGLFLAAHTEIENFFGKHFDRRFEILVFPDRRSLDKQMATEKKDSSFKSPCDQIGFSNALRIYLLSPDEWKSQSCSEKSNNEPELKKAILSELINVYHSQYNFSPDVGRTPAIYWFTKGLINYLSGETDSIAIIPDTLNSLSQLDEKTAGAFAKFIDEKYGREKLFYLLQFSSGEQIAETLEKTEQQLIAEMKKHYE